MRAPQNPANPRGRRGARQPRPPALLQGQGALGLPPTLVGFSKGVSEALIPASQPAWRQPLTPAPSQQGGEVGLGSAFLEAINHCPGRGLQPAALCKAWAIAMCCPQVSGCRQRALPGVFMVALGSGSAITASARLTPRVLSHSPSIPPPHPHAQRWSDDSPGSLRGGRAGWACTRQLSRCFQHPRVPLLRAAPLSPSQDPCACQGRASLLRELPARDAEPPARDAEPPTWDARPPARDAEPPARDAEPPARQGPQGKKYL